METKTKKNLYKSMISRDPRNDGRFYVGVKTTGIYCRPICPAKPKFENVEFYKSKAEAENAGFRPCLRCRPDVSPLSVRWQGTAAVMSRALKILEEVDEAGGELNQVAERLGMTDRHLRRLFQEHLGAAPIDIAISRRLHLARQLLSEKNLSILDIALASGFSSLRRFNDAFVKAYKVNPSTFRKDTDPNVSSRGEVTLALPYVAPYDWDSLIAFFRRHQAEGIEHIEDNLYVRQFPGKAGPSLYKIKNNPKKSYLDVELTLSSLEDLRPTVERIRAQFDLAHNPFHIDISEEEISDDFIETLQEVRKMRIPGSFDTFENAISIILSQLVSTERARDLLGTVIAKFGTTLDNPLYPGLNKLFPTPETLMNADFQGIGVTKARAEAIRLIASAVHERDIELSPSADLDTTKQKLLALKGIGPWTVAMISMRCLSDADAFPAKDLIVDRALKKFSLPHDFLAPWRAYFALAVWKTQAHLLTKKGKGPHVKDL
ncbi:MAG: DNA-3-methyladenine glycosylase 2 family protein [Proteobacteria bacterium]|nr:MAG: DNA-3-methyladenine glycosylase 2 family protein [Pseudomonadota bacterium]